MESMISAFLGISLSIYLFTCTVHVHWLHVYRSGILHLQARSDATVSIWVPAMLPKGVALM